jgi:hypothetical protein
MAERSIYAYDPLIPPEREVRARVAAMIEERRGTRRCTRFAETYILTCWCGAVTVTRDMGAPGRFDGEHASCREAS